MEYLRRIDRDALESDIRTTLAQYRLTITMHRELRAFCAGWKKTLNVRFKEALRAHVEKIDVREFLNDAELRYHYTSGDSTGDGYKFIVAFQKTNYDRNRNRHAGGDMVYEVRFPAKYVDLAAFDASFSRHLPHAVKGISLLEAITPDRIDVAIESYHKALENLKAVCSRYDAYPLSAHFRSAML